MKKGSPGITLISQLTICLIFFSVNLKGQGISPEIADKIRNEVISPKSDLSFNLSFSEDNIQVNKEPAAKRVQEPLPEELNALLAYIEEKEIKNSYPFIQAYNLLVAENRPQEGMKYLVSGVERLSQYADATSGEVEIFQEIALIQQFAGRPDLSAATIATFLEENPEHARGYALLGLMESAAFQLDSCHKRLLSAYEIDPNEPQIYVTAFSEALFRAIFNLSKFDQDKDLPDFPEWTDMGFLEQAIAENPKNEMAQIALLSLKTMGAFLQTVFFNSQKLDLKEQVELDIPKWAKKQVKETESYLESRITNYKRPELPWKLMLICAVISQENEEVNKWMTFLGGENSKDVDAIRLRVMHYLLDLDYLSAMPFAERVTELEGTPGNWMLLSRIAYEAGQFEKGDQAGATAISLGEPRPRPIYMASTIALKKDQIEKCRFYLDLVKNEGVSGEELDEMEVFPAYVEGVLALLSGDQEKAREWFSSLPADSGEAESAEIMLDLLR